YNPRGIDQSQVKKLAVSFDTGLERYLSGHLFPLTLPREAIVEPSITQDPGGGGDDFPMLQLGDIEGWILHACGGQNQLGALRLMEEELREKITKQMALCEKLTAAMEKGKGQPEELSEENDKLMGLKGELKGLGFWGAALYEWSKLSDATVSLSRILKYPTA